MKFKMPLWLYFLSAAVLSITVAAILYFFVFLNAIERPYLAESIEQNEEITKNSGLYLEAKLEEQYNIIMGIELAHHNILEEGAIFPEEYYETILEQNQYINVIEVLSNDNKVIYSSLEGQNRVGLDLSDYYLFEGINNIHELAIGNMSYGTGENELQLEIAYSGEDCTILSFISVSYFESFGEEMKESFEDKEFMIIEGNGKLIYDSKDNLHTIRYRTEYFEDIVKLYNSNGNSIIISEKEHIASVERFNDPEWYIVSYEELQSALELQYKTVETLSVILAIISSIYIVIYLVFNYSILREFKYLGHRLDKLSSEESNVFDVKPSALTEVNFIREKFSIIGNDLLNKTEELRFLAYNDTLTRLPSKNKAVLDFNYLKNKWESVSLVYLDLKRFGVINENFGFSFGDEIIKIISKRLVNKFQYFYRIDGDEFLIITEFDTLHTLEDLMYIIKKSFKSPIMKDGVKVKVDYNVGVSSYPSDSTMFDDLFSQSIVAMYEAKKSSYSSYVVFDKSKKMYYKRLSQIEILLQSAFERKEFTTIYQPIVHIETEEIRGFEALSRWKNNELGSVFPDEFVPILEKIHLISILDKYVLNNSIKMIKFLNERYNKQFVISVNLSVETIMLDNFTDIIDEYLNKYSLDPKLLELEITESTLIRDFDGITKKIQYLINKGVKFSEDDFGDGYSSLTYLSRLNLDTLKISKNFLTNIISNVESRYLVQTIINLSKKLGFLTIVEGVEDKETFQLFKEYQCDFVQGYLFYKPQNESKLIDTLDKKYKKGSK